MLLCRIHRMSTIIKQITIQYILNTHTLVIKTFKSYRRKFVIKEITQVGLGDSSGCRLLQRVKFSAIPTSLGYEISACSALLICRKCKLNVFHPRLSSLPVANTGDIQRYT